MSIENPFVEPNTPAASELAASDMPLKDQMARHFLYHHYPPAPMRLIDTAIEAIVAVNSGQGNAPIGLPRGFVVRYDVTKTPTAQDVMQGLNLNAWLCACVGCSEGNPHWTLD